MKPTSTVSLSSAAYFGVALALAGCGAKTGLPVPDSGTDSGECSQESLALEQRTPEILFVLDQSRSMEFDLAGETPAPGGLRRWDLLGQALVGAVSGRRDDLAFGVLLYPDAPNPITEIEEACQVFVDLELPVSPAPVARLERLFAAENPLGGTPTAAALRSARSLLGEPQAGVQRFVVLATDGAPNCNSSLRPPPACFCTSDDLDVCNDPELGPYQCLDDVAAVQAVTDLAEEDGVPVYVIGIEDPNRPEFAATLDAMAIAGGRARPPGGSRFYDIQEAADLDDALSTITATIQECVFYLDSARRPEEVAALLLDGVPLPRDVDRSDGWDWTRPADGELTLFGNTCERAISTGAPVRAVSACR